MRKSNIGKNWQNGLCKSKFLHSLTGRFSLILLLFTRKEYVQREFDDYTSDSQQLEKEYEATIEQHEKTMKELRSANNKAHNEIDSLHVSVCSVYNSINNNRLCSVEVGTSN